MRLNSCSNCWFNGLQYGSVGLDVGYCTEHKVVLRQADHTTCGRHFRKDLLLDSAVDANGIHSSRFSMSNVVHITGKELQNGTSHYISTETEVLDTDSVSKAVAEYGELDTKIASLSQLRNMPGARAELARLSLGRAYVYRCVSRNSAWTSGVHLLWWAIEKIAYAPALDYAHDIRLQYDIDVKRQIELAQWSIIMLRIAFMSDMGLHAIKTESLADSQIARDISPRISEFATFADESAEFASTDLKMLMKWITQIAVTKIKKILPYEAYKKLSWTLHQD